MQNGLKMHNIASMEMAKHKENATNAKLERSFETIDKVYSISKLPKTTNTKNLKYHHHI